MRRIIQISCFTAVVWGTLAVLMGSMIALAQAPELTFTGKLICSLKRPVILPVAGEILSLLVEPGRKVKKGEILGHYRLVPESLQGLRRQLSPARITELRARMAEFDKNLTALKSKEKSLKELLRQNLAAPQSLEQVEREIEALSRQRSALQEGISQAEHSYREEQALLQKQLGVSFKSGQIPTQGVLVAPIEGYVLWMHPDLRPRAELKGGTPVILVGVMDPMLLRALVHEIEALKLKVGDEANITLESLPGRKFKAQVSRLPWAPTAISLENPTYYEVEFLVPNPDLVLKEGLKATLEIPKPGEKSPPVPPKDKGNTSSGVVPGKK